MTAHTQPQPPLTIAESGSGPTVLVLHGGAGPASVAGIAEHLSRSSHVIAPTHPGWNGTPLTFDSIGDLSRAYLDLLHDRDLQDVLVVGSSIGGWIAAEMAVHDHDRRIGGLVLIDATGVWFDDEPITDFFALDARGVAEHSYHDPARFYQDPAGIPAAESAMRQGNMAALRTYAADPYMHNPRLLPRLTAVTTPTLLLWGESDRIVTPAYGAAYAAAFADARFEIIRAAGHLPQLEQPEATFDHIDGFLRSVR
ncbi:alpha/beta fold hydrolase [Nocardia pseudovaccinii]|uniref:alpha/beta fold hydrolase n=1 Tax=Nocardia pseudovaccinii TaxID=189540 RepID=UPI0007A45443|nr:alpha/beta hydrolase [Nocardia pseudovaccinii]